MNNMKQILIITVPVMGKSPNLVERDIIRIEDIFNNLVRETYQVIALPEYSDKQQFEFRILKESEMLEESKISDINLVEKFQEFLDNENKKIKNDISHEEVITEMINIIRHPERSNGAYKDAIIQTAIDLEYIIEENIKLN